MEKRSKRRSRPMPDALSSKAILYKLEDVLDNENPLICNYSDRKPWEVTMSSRDAKVRNMKYLKVWFDLPPTVFFTAVSYLDSFLARMKVQEKFLSCLSVSCFNLAASKFGFSLNACQLIMLSKSECSVKDMERMSGIINQKLNLGQAKDHSTALDVLYVFIEIFRFIAYHFEDKRFLGKLLEMQQEYTRLESLICDCSCSSYKSSIFVLAFVHVEWERFLKREVEKTRKSTYTSEMFYVLAIMIELQALCKINGDDYFTCFNMIKKVLNEYDSKPKTPVTQRSISKISNSTRKITHNYFPVFNTIKEEEIQNYEAF